MKRLLKILALVATLCIACNKSSDDTFDIPDGYIAIYSAQDLALIGTDDNYPLSGSYILANSIELTSEWAPIGCYEEGAIDAPFTGIFEGNGAVISGLSIDTTDPYQGLFGYVRGATIRNITIKNPSVSGGDYVAALVGNATQNTTIYSCRVLEGEIWGDIAVGGVVGWIEDGSISYCYNTSEVSGSVIVGGVVGWLDGSDIVACFNTGEADGDYDIGGVVGTSATTTSRIIACYNTGEASGSTDVGGVVGHSVGSIIACFNAGVICGDDSYVGGVVGWLDSGSSVSVSYHIEREEDEVTSGLGVGTGVGSVDTITLYNLNTEEVEVMNFNISMAGYSSVEYQTSSQPYTLLPSLMGEYILFGS